MCKSPCAFTSNVHSFMTHFSNCTCLVTFYDQLKVRLGQARARTGERFALWWHLKSMKQMTNMVRTLCLPSGSESMPPLFQIWFGLNASPLQLKLVWSFAQLVFKRLVVQTSLRAVVSQQNGNATSRCHLKCAARISAKKPVACRSPPSSQATNQVIQYIPPSVESCLELTVHNRSTTPRHPPDDAMP